MKYIVYDLELNSKPFKSNVPNEIIEIGAIKINNGLEVEDTFQSFVKPRHFKKLFPVVRKKTNISQEHINNADCFKDIIKRFRNWIGEDYLLVSWGHDDIHHLFQNCKYNRINTNWLNKNIDLQKQFSSINDLPQGQRLSLENALKFCGIKIGEDLHRALTDAEYTSRIFTGVFDKLDLELHTFVKLKKRKQVRPRLTINKNL